MRERANRDEIHARVRIRTNIFQADTARTLHRNFLRSSRAALDSLANHLWHHVVEQDRLCAELKRLIEFLEALHFDLDNLIALAVLMRALQRRTNSAGQCDVVVLDQHAVREIEPVILSSAAAHGIFIEHAQAEYSLAGVEDLRSRALDRVHELARQRGRATQALQ